MNKNLYTKEKYYYKNKENITTNIRLDAHELYLVHQALLAENIKINTIEEAFNENNKILSIINCTLAQLKKEKRQYEQYVTQKKLRIEKLQNQLENKINSLKLDTIEPNNINLGD